MSLITARGGWWQTQQLLATVFLVVLTTTLLLYPFIVSLNRKVRAEAQATHFDPRLLEAFQNIAPELHAYFDRVSDKELEKDLRAVVTHYWNSETDIPWLFGGKDSSRWRPDGLRVPGDP